MGVHTDHVADWGIVGVKETGANEEEPGQTGEGDDGFHSSTPDEKR